MTEQEKVDADAGLIINEVTRGGFAVITYPNPQRAIAAMARAWELLYDGRDDGRAEEVPKDAFGPGHRRNVVVVQGPS